jgi:ribosomal protein S17E
MAEWTLVLFDDQSMQDFIDENPVLHSVYCISSGELRDAVAFYIEQHMAREKFDPNAKFMFKFDPDGETHVAVKRTVRTRPQ